MDQEFFQKIMDLLVNLWNAEPSFYREKYAWAGFTENNLKTINPVSFKTLPLVTKNELAETRYRDRIYEEKSGLNKLVFSEEANTYFLIHRTLEEIRGDALPVKGERPMVILSNVYEAIEGCLFFYENGTLPLIGEIYNPAVIYSSARQYQIDTLFIDHASILKLRKELLAQPIKIRHVTIIDSSFYTEDLDWPENIEKTFVFSIPEFGRIAYACQEFLQKKELILHPYDDVYIEPSALSILTSTRLKACPMIRYQSAVYIEQADARCNCGKTAFKI